MGNEALVGVLVLSIVPVLIEAKNRLQGTDEEVSACCSPACLLPAVGQHAWGCLRAAKQALVGAVCCRAGLVLPRGGIGRGGAQPGVSRAPSPLVRH